MGLLVYYPQGSFLRSSTPRYISNGVLVEYVILVRREAAEWAIQMTRAKYHMRNLNRLTYLIGKSIHILAGGLIELI